MSDFVFTKAYNGVNVKKDGITIHNWILTPQDIRPTDAGYNNGFVVQVDRQAFTFYFAGNTYTLNGNLLANDSEAICNALRDQVFVNNITAI